MKKLFSLILIGVALFGVFKIGKLVFDKIDDSKYNERVKTKWYLEIVSDTLKIREHATANSKELALAKKGDLFEILDYNLDDGKFYWFQIKLRDGSKGWVGNPRKGTKYLIDYNGSIDVATPTIAFDEGEYHVVSIKDINYDHLRCWDDRDEYTVTHKVYHEVKEVEEIDQYWIKYTITDAAGKSSSKTQKIVFENTPDESEVLPFSEFNRD